MPVTYTAAELALIHLPVPYHVPRGQRRIADPELEALAASRWHWRRGWESEGFVFPDHPRPRVPAGLRRDFPEWAAEDDARDA
ncbi:hypothetical protein, partial [Rubellimicrobium mesophilum]|uniref:hypothetical protein n=1 Tax=Rubellimicrobium mesophilum TaxID=1123067 RepID=UPI0005617109